MKPVIIGNAELWLGDCLDALRAMPDNSVDSVVTDPPYGLSFMGKKWDYDVPSIEIWSECLRVLKPGGHLLAFAGTRTQHRMAVRIEDAGFEIRDMIAWVYGSGFPKSFDVSKAIDKAAGAAREVAATIRKTPSASSGCNEGWVRPWAEGKTTMDITLPASDAARQWQGWGTALKPALEPLTVARKPLIGTVAENVLTHGTGALNIDGCRVPTNPAIDDPRLGGNGTWASDKMAKNVYEGGYAGERVKSSLLGRWPANLIHDGSDEVLQTFPQAPGQSGAVTGSEPSSKTRNTFALYNERAEAKPRGDTGSAARFFYCAKASKRDRDEGMEAFDTKQAIRYGEQGQGPEAQQTPRKPVEQRNFHPTVKPTELMRYLCRLVTPPGGVVLDPFLGSGSTGKAAMLEGFRFVGCELSPEYMAIAEARIAHAAGAYVEQTAQADLFQVRA